MGWETDMERETGRRARAQGAWKQQEEGQRQDSHRLYQKVRRTAKQRRRNVRQDPARILVHPPSKNPHLGPRRLRVHLQIAKRTRTVLESRQLLLDPTNFY